MNWQAALNFVATHGNPVECARLRVTLDGTLPTPQAIQQLLAGQQADGGWCPFWAADYTSLDATCFRLAQGEQMGILASEAAFLRAAQFLTQRQSTDGSWEEDESAAGQAPPWAQSGDHAARLYLTANCGFWLAAFAATRPAAEHAADYLRSCLPADGHMPTFLHTHWLAAGLFYRLAQPEHGERILNYLVTRLPDLHASNLAWLITTLRVANMSVDTPMVTQAATFLRQQQLPAGNWPSEDGPDQDVHVTLEAMRALRWCGFAA